MGGRGSKSGMTEMTNEERKEEKKQMNESYKEFDATSDDGIFYNGDGQEQADFFEANSNFNELIEQMSEDEINLFYEKWISGEFMHGEGFQAWDDMADWTKNALRTYDKYLDQSVLKEGVVVSRLATAELLLGKGNKVGTLDQLKALEGQTIVSEGNMSAAAAKNGLAIGAKLSTHPDPSDYSKSCEYRIHIPKGSKGAGMWIGDKRVNKGFGRDQLEFMMNRDIRLKVGKTTHDKARDVYVVDLTFDGRLPHRYK